MPTAHASTEISSSPSAGRIDVLLDYLDHPQEGGQQQIEVVNNRTATATATMMDKTSSPSKASSASSRNGTDPRLSTTPHRPQQQAPSNRQPHSRTGITPREALYHQGATPLFVALEQGDWRYALELLDEEPEQACTWIVSTGTKNNHTVFQWSLWRRLPLHEACRRQAPAWLVSPLLQAYPEAASLPTQFGQLPLHLAVECSASPEVVNLLLVSYFQGVACTDQSGRTPLQILQDAEVTEIRAHQTVLESLQRANVSWRCIQSAHERQMRFLEQQHTNGLTEIRNQHQQDLQVEQDHAEKLLERVVLLDDALKVAKQDQAAAVAHAHKLEERDGVWQERITQLEKAMAEMTTLNDQEAQHVAALREVIQNKEKQIQGLQAEMASLRRSLQKVAVFANMSMLNQLNDTQSKIQNMLDSFVDLHETMELHRNELTGVAQTIGLSDDEVHGVVRRTECETNSTNTETVDKRDRNIEEEVDDEKAMQSAAMAAASVLIP